MNPIIAELHARKSVRAYEDKPIPPEVKKEILLAAMAAPTAGNQQFYTILDITDQKIKDRLAITCDNQPFIAKAKMVLIFCADLQKWYRTRSLQPGAWGSALVTSAISWNRSKNTAGS